MPRTKTASGTVLPCEPPSSDSDASNANFFRHYRQEENRFTNGLISLLSVSPPRFTKAFLKDMLGLKVNGALQSFCVLRDIPGHADAQLCGTDWCIWFETKIASGSLFHDQLRRHLKRLRTCKGRMKRLVLLTPDDGNSTYIKEIRAKYKPAVLHLEWRKVYDYLDRSATSSPNEIYSMLVRQFLQQIHDCIFDQDFAGIIQKVAFGDKSQIYSDTFIDELRSGAKGEWTYWDTPQKYEKLDGTGRKLMFYDRTRRAIVAEVEVRKVERTNHSRDFPWTNRFAKGTLRVYRKGKRIPLSHILTVSGYENFTKAWSGHWNVTHEQYRLLMEGAAEAD
jgi:hypothetical protein